jgi:hypothetical protein
VDTILLLPIREYNTKSDAEEPIQTTARSGASSSIPSPSTGKPVVLTATQTRGARIAYASDFDRRQIAEGIELATIAWGPRNTMLRIRYDLGSRVTANDFGTALNFEELGSLPFEKVEFTNDVGEELATASSQMER